MKITVYKNGTKLMCKIPGEKDITLMELALALMMLKRDDLIRKFGPDVPELVLECELTESEKAGMADIQKSLQKIYE